MNKGSFLDLLDRYQQNKCTQNEKFFVEQWYGSLDDQDLTLLTETEISQMSDRILLRLHANMEQHDIKNRTRSISWYKMGIAASVAVGLICASVFAYTYNSAELSFQQEIKSDLMSQTNTTNKLLTITLSDQSKVTLQPRASISYPAVFSAGKRQVYLKGDAFFSISKNPKKPFYVYNNKLEVKVLGTSFFIKEADAQVSVRTGKVQVNENKNRKLFAFMIKKQARTVLLTPNQQAILDVHQHQISKTLVPEPIPLATAYQQPGTNPFKFAEASLKDVFDTLSKSYGIRIQLENENIAACTFTGDIDKKGLYEQLNLICQSISGTYKVNGTSIRITANCN